MKKRSNGAARRRPAREPDSRPRQAAVELNDVLQRPVPDAWRLAAALGRVARAHGMSRLSEATGLTREGLYKALAPDGNPSLDTVMRVAAALGVRFAVEVVEPPREWRRIDAR